VVSRRSSFPNAAKFGFFPGWPEASSARESAVSEMPAAVAAVAAETLFIARALRMNVAKNDLQVARRNGSLIFPDGKVRVLESPDGFW